MADFRKLDLDDESVLRWIIPHLKLSRAQIDQLPLDRQWKRIEEEAMRAEGIGVAEIRRLAAACKAHLAALSRHVPRPYPGAAVLFTADQGRSDASGPWDALCPRLRVERVSGNHYTMLQRPHVDGLAERLGSYLKEILAAEK
jgi:thioesterase domain-containing protein